MSHAPGFVPVVAKNLNTQRGGVVALFKHDIFKDVNAIDTSADSPYFSSVRFSEIQAKTQNNTHGYVLVGYMNTRCGDKVKVKSYSFQSSLTYRKREKWISEVDYCLITDRYISVSEALK